MSDKIVMDSSAMIALLEQEKGSEIVARNLSNAIISSVNLSEVITIINRKIAEDEGAQEEALRLLRNSFPNIISFEEEQAIIAGSLDKITKKYCLSLGDKACLALAKYKNCPVLTADKVWKKLELGIDVRLIR
jgi:ribonuclease VapC